MRDRAGQTILAGRQGDLVLACALDEEYTTKMHARLDWPARQSCSDIFFLSRGQSRHSRVVLDGMQSAVQIMDIKSEEMKERPLSLT